MVCLFGMKICRQTSSVGITIGHPCCRVIPLGDVSKETTMGKPVSARASSTLLHTQRLESLLVPGKHGVCGRDVLIGCARRSPASSYLHPTPSPPYPTLCSGRNAVGGRTQPCVFKGSMEVVGMCAGMTQD